LYPMIEPPFARQIMVETDEVRCRSSRRQLGQDLFAGSLVAQPAIEWVARNHAAGEQVEGQPAPLVLMLGLILQQLRREGLSDVLGRQQPSAGDDLSDGLDRPFDRQAL